MRGNAGKKKCSSGNIVPGDQRNILQNNFQKLLSAVTKAIEYRKSLRKNLMIFSKPK
jgi:hypothetical protein